MGTKLENVEPFDPNGDSAGAIFPTAKSYDIGLPINAADYVRMFSRDVERPTPYIEKILEAMQRALSVPPTMLSYARMAFMPDPQNEGVIQWPGINPESLRRVATENVAPQLIIGMRCDDVMRYSTLSNHPWKPGYRIELMEGGKHPSDTEKREMREAEEFLFNGNMETGYTKARARDAAGLTDFQRFLSALTRDSLTYDGMAIYTVCDNLNRVKQFSLLPAGNIRLVDKKIGYKGDKDIFAVGVNESNVVVATFRRDQLVWYVRNPRADPDIGGYGYPEIEISMKLIQGFQNALDLNLGTFNQSAVPNGMLVLTGGGYNQKQLDVLTRIWNNLKRGVTKAWALPVIATPKDGTIELIDLQNLKDTDVRYQDFMNMVAGGFCTVYRFPNRRLGYRISGKGPDARPLPTDAQADGAQIDEDDPGLAPLLTHIENVINQYLLWTRWPHLRFVFTGKNPKEDARQYDAKKNAMTWKEARAQADLPPLTEELTAKAKEGGDGGEHGKEVKLIAKLMELCPIDPNMAGVYQSIVATFAKGIFEVPKDPATPGNRMTSQRDPAKSEAHGATSGVRRNSAAEGGK